MKITKSLKTVEELQHHGLISEQEIDLYRQVTDKFNVLVTPEMTKIMLQEQATDPIRQQFMPSLNELNETSKELQDPTGDLRHEIVKGVVHRYSDRCLLKVVSVCPIYCRFCFRKELIGPRKPSLTQAELQEAYDYISNHKQIWEVILTGGDPFILKPTKLSAIISALASIKHIEIIRIHTRVPIVDPHRINDLLTAALKCQKTVFVVLHVNHPKEFTEHAEIACAKLVDAGIPLLSQSVLLKGINDNVETLCELMKKIVKNRIKPYYLHHPDLAKGTSHFRVTIEEGQRLVREMQGRISGLCQPNYVLEIPGGCGKMPINPCYAHRKDNAWEIEDQKGVLHTYED